ncbi:MAG: hypothetical protein BWX50_01312 [Euryarchaeota archaeon ADurb.Bin009]|nr:MAG: hypothetical protein BWX50_01312 [Euryarchaeota archaeon ADurb.Bin009]
MVVEVTEGRNPRRKACRVAAERPRLVDGSRRRDQVHDVAPPSEGPDGEAAADDLAERGDIGLYIIKYFGAADADPVAGDHLIEYEEDPVGGGDLADVGEVAAVGEDRPDVPHDRLEYERGDVVVPGKDRLQRLRIVVRDLPGVCRKVGEDAGGVGHTEGGRSRPGLHEDRIVGAVEPALDLDDVLFPGISPREPDSGHRRLRTRRDEPDHIDAGVVAGDDLRKVDLKGRRRAVEPALLELALYRLPDDRVRVAEDERTVAETAVDEIRPVDGRDTRARRPLHVERVGLDGPDRAADAARHQGLCPCEEITALHRATSLHLRQSK